MTDILAHATNGDGPPLLLLNGGLMTIAAWEPYVTALAPSLRVVGCDLRGQLLSPGAPPATFQGHADDLVRLLDTLAIDTVHVAGASFGALVGVVLAASARQRVRSLTVITATDRMTPHMDDGTRRLREACREALAGGDGGRILDLINPATWSPEYLQAQATVLAARRRGVAMLPPAWFIGLDGLLTSMLGLDLRPLLPSITCPTVVIGGECDVTFPVEHSRDLARGIPGARLVIVPDAPHGLVIERAPAVIDLLKHHVADVEARERSRATQPEVRS
jgi:pimeloyl-ACP methyl ester carboxylesterase